MTVADKLTYLGETKDLLANAINGYTKVVNADTPFREYAQWIDNIVFSLEGGIASLFDEGEGGFAWSSLPYYQDPAGTTEAVWGNPVGLIEDATDNGVEFTQATVTARPILGRVPVGGRRNLLSNSQFYGAAVGNSLHTFTGWTITNAGLSSEIIAVDADRIVFRLFGVAVGNFFILASPVIESTGSFYTHSANAWVVSIEEGEVSPLLVVRADSQSTTLPLPYEDSGVLSVSRDTALGESVTARVSAMLSVGEFHDFTIAFGVPQLENSANPSPYQSVRSDYDITEEGAPDVYYLHFDLVDDSVSTTLPAITNGTLVLAGTNGIWIDDDFNHAGGAFSIGPTSYTNGPAGILPIVGDLLVGGCFVVDRQLTAEERTRVINKLKSMGAPGVFELGPELNSNSGPNFVDTLNWFSIGGAELYVADGELRAKNTTLQFGRARRNITEIEPGQHYLASFSTRGVEGTPSTNLGYSNIQTGYLQVTTTPVTMSVAITAVPGENNVLFNLQNTNSSEENEGAVIYYSLRKLELIP